MKMLNKTVNDTPEAAMCPLEESYKHILLPLAYSIVCVLGLLLNGAMLWLCCCHTKEWTCTTIYLVNLAVADLLYIFSLPLLIIDYAMQDIWLFGELLCKMVRFLFYNNLYGSILLLTCISVHRFLGICYPIRSLAYKTRRLAVIGSAVSWILVLIQVLPSLFYARTGFINNRTVCYDLTSPDNFSNYYLYGMVLTVSGFLCPFLIILICYCLMIRSLIQTTGKTNLTSSAARAKSIRTIVLVCGLFAVCLAPFHITRAIYLYVRVHRKADCRLLQRATLFYKIWRPLVGLNSCFSPLLYFLSGQTNTVRLILELRLHKVDPLPRPTVKGKETVAPRGAPPLAVE
ncbi:ATP-dependent RNA helicase DHX8 [Platysternon megacephalum]|uniref:ATP-dependent RNA helicase DHX8 n=1 Tax=Platysternon megacephalum TaxID=55544 RepID=A0A4D9EZS3_9SAUR|nr:ATP-dependent RNA helicase DHX8 [Platysternon megacephalum]